MAGLWYNYFEAHLQNFLIFPVAYCDIPCTLTIQFASQPHLKLNMMTALV